MGIPCSYNNKRKKINKDRNQSENEKINNIGKNNEIVVKDKSEINIIYNINKEISNNINIFGSNFVKNNKNICKMIIENREYEIAKKYNINNYNKNILQIKLKGIKNVKDMSCMFEECSSLSLLPDISKWNTNNVTNMNGMFGECSSLLSLPDISNWNTNNVTDMRGMFAQCSSLLSLLDISIQIGILIM